MTADESGEIAIVASAATMLKILASAVIGCGSSNILEAEYPREHIIASPWIVAKAGASLHKSLTFAAHLFLTKKNATHNG